MTTPGKSFEFPIDQAALLEGFKIITKSAAANSDALSHVRVRSTHNSVEFVATDSFRILRLEYHGYELDDHDVDPRSTEVFVSGELLSSQIKLLRSAKVRHVRLDIHDTMIKLMGDTGTGSHMLPAKETLKYPEAIDTYHPRSALDFIKPESEEYPELTFYRGYLPLMSTEYLSDIQRFTGPTKAIQSQMSRLQQGFYRRQDTAGGFLPFAWAGTIPFRVEKDKPWVGMTYTLMPVRAWRHEPMQKLSDTGGFMRVP